MPFNSFLNYPLSWKPDRQKLERPIYLSLALQMEKDIARGLLPPGTKLPPQRELADFLDINFTTVTRAYKLCELKGLLYAVTGRGTFVSANAAQSITISADGLPRESIDLGFVASFEQCNSMISETAKKVLEKRQFAQLASYDYPSGMPHQKAAGVGWLRDLGLETDPEHVAIVSGTQNGLALTLFALFDPSNRIAVDTYTYANFIDLAKMYHLQLVPVGGDSEGMSAELLEEQCRLNPIQGIFLMPSCCNPTTVMISERRKRELAAVIQKHRLTLIEDDIHAFLTAGVVEDYQGPIARFVPDQAVYISGTSKPICSGLRVAYASFGEPLRERMLRAVFTVNVKTSSLDAEIITELLGNGTAAKIIAEKKLLAVHANRLFDQYFPLAPRSGHPLSFYRWIPIRSVSSGREFEAHLQEVGVRVYHSDRFLSGGVAGQQYLRIALSSTRNTTELERGLEILKSRISLP